LRHVRFPVPFSKRAEGFRVTCATPWGNAGKTVLLLGELVAKMKCDRCGKRPRAILFCEAERCARVRSTFLNALGTIFASSPTLAVFGGIFPPSFLPR
jgi:hypothetical protein